MKNFMLSPLQYSAEVVYGYMDTISAVKLVTMVPELEGSLSMIETLSKKHGVIVSLGHSTADIDTGVAGIRAGARALTHVFNAMNPYIIDHPGWQAYYHAQKLHFIL